MYSNCGLRIWKIRVARYQMNNQEMSRVTCLSLYVFRITNKADTTKCYAIMCNVILSPYLRLDPTQMLSVFEGWRYRTAKSNIPQQLSRRVYELASVSHVVLMSTTCNKIIRNHKLYCVLTIDFPAKLITTRIHDISIALNTRKSLKNFQKERNTWRSIKLFWLLDLYSQ